MAGNLEQELRSRLDYHEKLVAIAMASPGALRRRLLLHAVVMLSIPVLFIAGCVLLAAAGVLAGYAFVDFDLHLLVIPLLAVGFAGAGVYAALNGLTARVPRPREKVLAPSEYPALFEFIEDTRVRAGGPPLDAVVLQPMLNAAVREDWESMLSRKPRYTLLLGFELMELSSLEEFRSTLAHEMGHLAARDTYYNAWASRVLLCWAHIFDSVGRTGTLVKMLSWFWDRFHESHSVLRAAVSRQAEVRADSIEAGVTSREIAARSLTRFAVYQQALHFVYEHELGRRQRREPVPPPDLFAQRLEFLRKPLDPEVEKEMRRLAGSEATTFGDSHPAFRARLAALGVEDPDTVELTPVVVRASVLLGDKYDALVAQMEQEWRKQILPAWREGFSSARHDANERAELEKKRAAGSIDDNGLFRLCEIEIIDLPRSDRLARIDDFLANHPDHVFARFLRGLQLLRHHEDAGITDLEFGMARNPALRPQGLEVLGHHLLYQGRYQEMLEIAARVDGFTREKALAEKERDGLTPACPLAAHRLTPAQVELVLAAARTNQRIVRIDVVRAETRQLPEQDFHLVVVEAAGEQHSRPDTVRYHVARQLNFPNRVLVVPGDKEKWLSAARSIAGSAIYKGAEGS